MEWKWCFKIFLYLGKYRMSWRIGQKLQTSSLKLVFHAGSEMWNYSSFHNSHPRVFCLLRYTSNDWPCRRHNDYAHSRKHEKKKTFLQLPTKVRKWCDVRRIILIPFSYLEKLLKTPSLLTERYELLECFFRVEFDKKESTTERKVELSFDEFFIPLSPRKCGKKAVRASNIIVE